MDGWMHFGLSRGRAHDPESIASFIHAIHHPPPSSPALVLPGHPPSAALQPPPSLCCNNTSSSKEGTASLLYLDHHHYSNSSHLHKHSSSLISSSPPRSSSVIDPYPTTTHRIAVTRLISAPPIDDLPHTHLSSHISVSTTTPLPSQTHSHLFK